MNEIMNTCIPCGAASILNSQALRRVSTVPAVRKQTYTKILSVTSHALDTHWPSILPIEHKQQLERASACVVRLIVQYVHRTDATQTYRIAGTAFRVSPYLFASAAHLFTSTDANYKLDQVWYMAASHASLVKFVADAAHALTVTWCTINYEPHPDADLCFLHLNTDVVALESAELRAIAIAVPTSHHDLEAYHVTATATLAYPSVVHEGLDFSSRDVYNCKSNNVVTKLVSTLGKTSKWLHLHTLHARKLAFVDVEAPFQLEPHPHVHYTQCVSTIGTCGGMLIELHSHSNVDVADESKASCTQKTAELQSVKSVTAPTFSGIQIGLYGDHTEFKGVCLKTCSPYFLRAYFEHVIQDARPATRAFVRANWQTVGTLMHSHYASLKSYFSTSVLNTYLNDCIISD